MKPIQLLVCGFLMIASVCEAQLAEPYRAADVLTDIKLIGEQGRVSPRLLNFIVFWEKAVRPSGDLKSSVGWRLCTLMRVQEECFSGAGNDIDQTIGWGLCMAAGRSREDCLKRVNPQTLVQSIGWGLCTASGRAINDCLSGDGNNLDMSPGWGLCMASGRPRAECFSGEEGRYDETLEWGVCMAQGGEKADCLAAAKDNF